MAKKPGLLERLTNKRSLAQWDRRMLAARSVDADTLREQARLARKLRVKLNEVLFVADDRLGTPMEGSDSFPQPKGTDWAWRPDLWRGSADEKGVAGVESGHHIMNGTAVYHDCQTSELTYRQVRNTRRQDLAAYGVRLDVFDFDGSFLSLAIELPSDCCESLRRAHLFRLDAVIETERPLEVFARLNVKHGPNTDQVVRELVLDSDTVWVEFDLGQTKIHEKQVEKIWLDLIFERPEMNQITMRDITLCRLRRAGM